jgi:hypothetical protein
MQRIDEIDYSFDFEKSAIILNKIPEIDSLKIAYKTFPVNFTMPVSIFKKENYLIAGSAFAGNYDYVISNDDYKSFQYDNSISRKGSIARGVSFGNNQDVIVNSNMNLQLDGKLGNDLFISAVISDNNIPIQPDGTSQQLQEFDKVFIKLYNDKISLIVGDFELRKPKGYFLNYFKKAQGGDFAIQTKLKNKKSTEININSSISGAIAKGKLRRQQIQGIEGNQGPYKLTGENGEMHIIVLAGTEKVYIDGILTTRGQNNDYTIDYNLGEIAFTSAQPINKDKRIIVEFEYSDKNYTRFLVTSSNTISFHKTDLWINIYNESDNKNQPFDQTLSIEDRKLLASIGDNINNAIVPGFDSIAFDPSEVRYKLVDTIVEGILHNSVFVHSTNPDDAHYRVNFSYVGENMGDYRKNVSAANGRVYEWIAPKNGKPQGDHIPYKKIITPQKSQIVTIGGQSAVTEKTAVNFELGYSNNDINTFSDLDAENDKGYAFKFGMQQDIVKSELNSLSAGINYEFLNKHFKAIENFRATEFTRDWNLNSLYALNNENILNGEINYFNNKHGNANYTIGYINRSDEYKGLQNNFSTNAKLNTWKATADISFLNSDDNLHNTKFLRHNAEITKDLWSLKLGLKELGENNLWKNKNNDSLSLNSFNTSQYEAFITTNDTIKNKVSLLYKYREDDLPAYNVLKGSTSSHDISFRSELNSNLNHRFTAILTYRKLNVKDTSLYKSNSENNAVGKVEYNLRAFGGILSSSTFCEIGSGLERKTEFSYIEVAPGQGAFTWTDYNNNGFQELDEFEIAHFADQANFIRAITPTAEYIKTYSSQLNQTINLNPDAQWRNKKGILNVLSKFSNQFIYSVAQKNTSDNFFEYANPFFGKVDQTKLVSLNSSLRNNFSFNRANPKFNVDYIIQSNSNKILLVSGFDTKTNFGHNLFLKYSFNSEIWVQNKIGTSNKTCLSEYFSNKNYEIDNKFNELQANYQPNLNNRLTIKYDIKQKDNTSGKETLFVNDLGIEYRLSSVKKGTLSATLNYIHYKYSGELNSPIAYEMLEGLMPGSNLTWSLNFQRQLSNGLQLNLNYMARKSTDTKTIHTGGIQIRAFF